jgi:hypothetical protein
MNEKNLGFTIVHPVMFLETRRLLRLLLLLLLLFTTIEFSLGGSSPYTSETKQIRLNTRGLLRK